MKDQTTAATLADFAITQRWPAKNPEILQLYSYPTPNGRKVSIMLEETGLAYEPHLVTLADTDVKSDAFLSLNPNNKIPAIIDPNGPDDQALGLFESGAILVYLAEKTGQLIGETAAERYTTLQWLMFQMGGVGPMFGQLGFFYKFAGAEIEDKRPQERYINESKRIMAVIEKQLEGRDWITGSYSIADIAIAPWLKGLEFYGALNVLGWEDHKNLVAYLDRFYGREAVQRGAVIPEVPA
ncbi:MAG: glutathione S-transferase family protein [Mangrovicoccus sp.]